ncbi:hypothetical protein EJC49_03230 [Aquibium carbonis]|uniref:Uncharacterized protein n=1 Tax=Aquibium carbonis TaxID=2495581 RepID=A0A3S0A3A9_9HYPH|nr:hypothetical protein EJC49_03230 [Aquibium carbonis]
MERLTAKPSCVLRQRVYSPTADCRLPTADCRLPTADCRLPTDLRAKRAPCPTTRRRSSKPCAPSSAARSSSSWTMTGARTRAI